MNLNRDFIRAIMIFAIVVSFIAFASIKLVDACYSQPKEPQLYTVHFDGIDYQDLEQIRSTDYASIYRTKAGKRIEFRGSFYEVEQ